MKHKTTLEAVKYLNERKQDETEQQRTIFKNDTFEHFDLDPSDDYTYEFLGEVLNGVEGHLSNNDDFEDIEILLQDWADEDVSIYTHELYEWAKQHGDYCEVHINEAHTNTMFNLLQAGQFDHRAEMYTIYYYQLVAYLEENVEGFVE